MFPRKRWKRSAVQHYAPDCAENTGSASVHTDALPGPDCPENYGSALLYSRTLTENSASVLLCSSALTDSPPGFPASNLDQHSLDIAARITPLEVDTKVANALLGASLILEQYRGVFERFQPGRQRRPASRVVFVVRVIS